MQRYLQPFSVLLLLCASLLVISIFIALGFYAYPAADDFCMVSGVEQNGLLPHLWEHYLIWSGRYSSNAFYALYPLLFGFFHGYPILALLLILSLFAGVVFFLSSLFRLSLLSPAVLIVSVGFVCVYLLGLRHTASSLYWMAGALSYQTANIFLLFMLGLMLKFIDQQNESNMSIPTLWWMLLIIALAMGTNETNMITMLGLIGLVFLSRVRMGWYTLYPWLIVLTLALICFAVVYFAPGNAERESTFPYRHDWARSIQGSWNMGAWTLVVWSGNPVFMAASLLIPFAVIELQRHSLRRFNITWPLLLMLFATTILLPFILQFPAWWSMGGWPPPRTVDAIFFVFLLSWMLFLGALTLRFHKGDKASVRKSSYTGIKNWTLLFSALIFVGALSINGKLRRAYQDLTERAPAFKTYTQARHAKIYEALGREENFLTVPAFEQDYPRSIYFNDIRTDPRDWRNVCYAQQFGLQGIAMGKRNKPTANNPIIRGQSQE